MRRLITPQRLSAAAPCRALRQTGEALAARSGGQAAGARGRWQEGGFYDLEMERRHGTGGKKGSKPVEGEIKGLVARERQAIAPLKYLLGSFAGPLSRGYRRVPKSLRLLVI